MTQRRLISKISVQLPLPDAAIAASAELTGRTLLTRHTRDFDALGELIAVEFYPHE